MITPGNSANQALEKILAATEVSVRPETFVLVGLPPETRAQVETDFAALAPAFAQLTLEVDVLTLLLPQEMWQKLQPAYPTANVTGPLRLFTFTLAMDWDVVGFLAAVTGVLAAAGIPLGAVCGYYRDHLFIAQPYAERAEAVLRAELERCRVIAR